jgi:hypothetical protein
MSNDKFLSNSFFLLILFITVINVAFFAIRIMTGADFTDETYAFVMAKTLINGAQLFLPEVDIHQTYAVYAVPVLKIVDFFTNSFDGSLFYTRILFYAYFLTIVFLIFRNFKDKVDVLFLTLLGVLTVTYVTYSNISLQHLPMNYYFLLPVVFILQFDLIKNSYLREFIIGLLTAICVVSYTTLAFVFLIFLIYRIVKKQSNSKELIFYFLGSGIAVLPIFFYLDGVTLQDVQYALNYNTSSLYPYFSFEKIVQFHNLSKLSYYILPSFILGYLGTRWILPKRRLQVFTAFTLAACVLFCTESQDIARVDKTVFAIGLFIIGSIFADAAKYKSIQFKVVLLLALLGITTAYSSSFLGLLGSSWVLTIFIILHFIHLYKNSETKLDKNLILTSIVAINISFSYNNYFNFWEDVKKYDFVKIESGPYKHLYTVRPKHEYITEMQNFLADLNNDDKLFIYYNFPAAYLMTKAQASSNLLWQQFQHHRNEKVNQIILDHFKNKNLPDYLLEMKEYISRRKDKYIIKVPETNSIKIFFKNNNYIKVKENEAAILYKKDLGQ